MSLIEVKVPDIGDFEDVEIIEVICNVDDMVAPGGSADFCGKRQGNHGCSLTGCGNNP